METNSSAGRSMDDGENIEDFSMRVLKEAYERRLWTEKQWTGHSHPEHNEELAIQHLVQMREKDRLERATRLERKTGGGVGGKENWSPLPSTSSSVLRSSSKTTLSRMGRLYSDEGTLTSPVHRTEANFSAANCEAAATMVGASRPEARTARLAALASTINQWEDDLSHPIISKQEPERKDRFGNIIGRKSARALQRNNKGAQEERGATKQGDAQTVWDKAILDTLEAQGFARCESKQHLVFDYASAGARGEGSPVECLSPSRKRNSPSTGAFKSNVVPARDRSPVKRSPQKEQHQHSGSPVRKMPREPSPVKESPVLCQQFNSARSDDRERSPVKISPAVQQLYARSPSPKKNSAVLEMAAQYEAVSGSPNRSTDPAQLSLKERKALFEKNGGCAIMPKAPLTSAVPIKLLNANGASNKCVKSVTFKPSGGVSREDLHVTGGLVSRVAEFERGPTSSRVHDPSREEREARERDMEVLRNMWTRAGAGKREAEEFVTPPPPPPLPQPEVKHTEYTMLKDVKRIRLSPPKPGRLYPSISDIESESCDTREEEDETSFESETSEGSLGCEIVQAATTQPHSTLKRYSSSASSSVLADESRVLRDIDDFLDEALQETSSPTSNTTSRSNIMEACARRMVSHPSGSCQSTSFEFSSSSATNTTEEDDVTTGEDDGDKRTVQLVHTISVYRRQQNTIMAEATTRVTRSVEDDDDDVEERREAEAVREAALAEARVKELTAEVTRQQNIMSQASQALNLCCATLEFSGSAEQLEAEKLLLIASSRRQACLNEIQRLKVEKRMSGGGGRQEGRGTVVIHRLRVPLKAEALRMAAREDECDYMVCLLRCGAQVLATDMKAALPDNAEVTADGRTVLTFDRRPLTLRGLDRGFTATVEVYSMKARSRELLPHCVKYHIQSGGATPSSKKGDKTPKKRGGAGAGDAGRLLLTPLQSPGGPHAVRTSQLKLAGYFAFSLKHLQRTSFALSKVQYSSVLDGSGNVEMERSCEADADVSGDDSQSPLMVGFLTVFQDVSGFGAWHRLWARMHSHYISFWKYPEDEETKIAIDSIDVSECRKGGAGVCPRDTCARPNTLLMEAVRPARHGDVQSLISSTDGTTTTVRHLLAADSRQEMQDWCKQINNTIELLSVWTIKANNV